MNKNEMKDKIKEDIYYIGYEYFNKLNPIFNMCNSKIINFWITSKHEIGISGVTFTLNRDCITGVLIKNIQELGFYIIWISLDNQTNKLNIKVQKMEDKKK